MPDRARLWDRLSRGIVFVATVVAVLALAWAVYLTQQTHTLTVETRDSQLNNKTTLNEITALQKQVTSVIEGLPKADKSLEQYAAVLVEDIQALCQTDHAACPPLPTPSK